MKTARQRLGQWGEQAAAAYLAGLGYTLLASNARSRYGELDLVALAPDGSATVFVEVKTRRSLAYGLPEASVTPVKQAHLLAASAAYLQAHPELPGSCRIDVIAILRRPGGQAPEIVHFENAVGAG
ncbi:MAG: YraN family protein [Chloroflexota bacterium]